MKKVAFLNMFCADTHPVFIGLGSNIGDAAGHVRQALDALDTSALLRVDAVSPFFRTEPQGMREQEWFINCVARLHVMSTFEPEALLSHLAGIEQSLGRIRNQKWGPRTIDLDILLWGDLSWDSPCLTIPHPRMCERAFVLVPLMHVAPDILIRGKKPKQWLSLLRYTLNGDTIRQDQPQP